MICHNSCQLSRDVQPCKAPAMAAFLTYALLLLLTTATKWSQICAQDSIVRVNSDYDESSCICGLSREILDRLELIVRTSTSSCVNIHSKNEVPMLEVDQGKSPHLRPHEVSDIMTEEVIPSTTSSPMVIAEDDKSTAENQGVLEAKPEQQVTNPPVSAVPEAPKVEDAKENPTNVNPNAIGTSGNPVHESGSGISSGSTSNSGSSSISFTTIEKLTIEIQRLEQQIQQLQQGSSTPGKPINQGAQNEAEQSASQQNESLKPVSNVELGSLESLVIDPTSIQNEALMKLNKSNKIDQQEMENALQSTVPTVVSNIFSNIQDLTTQAEKQPIAPPAAGGSVVKGDTTEEITASGEKLFLAWIEHQIESLHLTASAANYIRKSAINLFRKIVKQYVQRVTKVGDSLVDSMRLATQLALDNTQNLTGFLLRNYVNFAGGLMQIIGDQVSRVGKHLDTTGDTIAHTSVNPFDIVSNVFESLPNPAEYSKYFRAFGKQLLGQLTNQPEDASSVEGANQASNNEPHRGLISKTMGALSKTFGSLWG